MKKEDYEVEPELRIIVYPLSDEEYELVQLFAVAMKSPNFEAGGVVLVRRLLKLLEKDFLACTAIKN